MSCNVEIYKDNNSFVSVSCPDQWLHDELYDLFKIPVDNANSNHTKFTHERFYNKQTGRLPLGLLGRLLAHCKTYNVTIDPSLKNIRPYPKEEIMEWMDSIEFPFTPYQYQYDIVCDAIRLRRLVALADTGAGKSAVLYFLIRFYLAEMLAEGRDGKILIMIPNITLRSQIIGDFKSYGWAEADGWCHVVDGKGSKWTDKRVVITTWQSIQNMDDDYYEQFLSIVVDEVHGASAAKQTNILKRAIKAVDRVGLTGTLSGTEHHKTKVEQFVGTSKRYIETKELTAMGQTCPTQVYMMGLKYTDREIKSVQTLDYQAKVDYVHMHTERMRFICTKATALAQSGENVLVIFEKVEKGLKLYEEHLKEIGLGDLVRVVTGEVKGSDRDDIKAELEAKGGHIFLATWGTLSTGVSIKNLHGLILASSSKGRIRVLQTIGRLLRVHPSKKFAKIIDFTDIITNHKYTKSSFTDHARDRHGVYREKGHPVKCLQPNNLRTGITAEVYETLLSESNYRLEAKRLREGSV